MRTIWAAAVTAVALPWTAIPCRAGDREKAVAVVEEAVRAHGGEDALNRARNLSWTGAGTISLSGSTLPFTEETVLALPDRSRVTVDLNKRERVTLVLNGDKAWQTSGGSTIPLGKERTDEIREEAYVLWATTLTPILQSDKFTLSTLPDAAVDGAPAAGVKAVSKGHADLKLYFDKNSHLLVKLDRRGRMEGIPVEKSYLFGDYTDVDGVKLPRRQVELLNGKKLTERTSATFKVLSVPDDSAFGKP